MPEGEFGIVGTTQGPFVVERFVAEGGFAVVYRANHVAFRAPVALKCLKIPGTLTAEQREEFLEHFREEAELLYRLSAAIPAIVRPLHHDVLSSASGAFVPFIALEWLEGQTLASYIDERTAAKLPPLGFRDAMQLFTPVARALEAAHSFPGPDGPVCIVHRDIKPANIFLVDMHGTTVVKILDFGIARARDAASVIAGQSTRSTEGMATAFTPCYGAPEQWMPKRFGATGPWTDVFGLALSFLEMLVGRPVIDGDHLAMMGTIMDEKRRPTPRNEGLTVPDAVEAIFTRALAVDPRDRYASVGDFWDDLEDAFAAFEPSILTSPGRKRGSGTFRIPPARKSADPAVSPPSVNPSADTQIDVALAVPKDAPPVRIELAPVDEGSSGKSAQLGRAASGPLGSAPSSNDPPFALQDGPISGGASPTSGPASPFGMSLDTSPLDSAHPSVRRPSSRPATAPPRSSPIRNLDGRSSLPAGTADLRAAFEPPLRWVGAGLVLAIGERIARPWIEPSIRGVLPFELQWIPVGLVAFGLIYLVVRMVRFGAE